MALIGYQNWSAKTTLIMDQREYDFLKTFWAMICYVARTRVGHKYDTNTDTEYSKIQKKIGYGDTTSNFFIY